MEKGTDKRANRFLKLYPWYHGFTGDLLFYIAISTLFLTFVKNFSAAQIVALSSFSQLICILLQFPILFIIKKIGNTASVRLGAFLLLLSALFVTFGPNYYTVLVGMVFHDAATIFHNASVVALENNLDAVGRREDFVRLRTSANTVYAVITMLISFVASYMFNLDHYLPMYGCIATCTTGFLLTLFMRDCTHYNRVSRRGQKKERGKIDGSREVLLSLVAYAIFYTVVNHGQSEGKLFVQQNLLLDFDVEQTALILGAVICVSRIVRVFSNMVFGRLYAKYQSKMGVVLASLLGFSMGCILFGAFIPQVVVKIAVMALGYTVILFVRDPFRLYIQDVLFACTPKEQHQSLLTIMTFGVKVMGAGMGLAFSALLVQFPMVLVISIMFATSLIEVVLCVLLFRGISSAKRQAEEIKAD